MTAVAEPRTRRVLALKDGAAPRCPVCDTRLRDALVLDHALERCSASARAGRSVCGALVYLNRTAHPGFLLCVEVSPDESRSLTRRPLSPEQCTALLWSGIGSVPR